MPPPMEAQTHVKRRDHHCYGIAFEVKDLDRVGAGSEAGEKGL